MDLPHLMIVARSIAAAAGFAPSAVTIGNFDGVHLGHQHLFRKLAAAAHELNLKPTVLTFDPHPARVVAPQRAPRLLTTPEQRIALMPHYGIKQVLLLAFTPEIAHLTPEEFVDRIIARALGAKLVLVGENFRFGHKQAGDTSALIQLGRRYGYETCVAGAIQCRGRIVSSSAVRIFIESGNVSLACRFLNRPYSICGDVIPGHGVGSKRTVPTLNLHASAEVLPGRGVYITRTHDHQRQWNSITNVGYRPTFGGDALSIETFLLDPLAGETPSRICVEFLKYVRQEQKFETPEALKAQILRDVAGAQKYFHRLPAKNR